MDVLNAARADPADFARALRQFRGCFTANIYTVPGSREDNETVEGVAAVDEAIAFLGMQPRLAALTPLPVLAEAAAAHGVEQAADGRIGHLGRDGSTPAERVRALGGGDQVAEVIEYGAIDAVDAIRQLIVDDGVPDRGHRGILFDPRLRYAGVACGPHPEYRTMCVIDLESGPDWGRPLRVAAADERSILPGR